MVLCLYLKPLKPISLPASLLWRRSLTPRLRLSFRLNENDFRSLADRPPTHMFPTWIVPAVGCPFQKNSSFTCRAELKNKGGRRDRKQSVMLVLMQSEYPL
ncbi:hypothetical protein TNCV_3827791 [Trichonephila clavipes]|nr:hypothetical protein TNCV_3827791 [Trichonephila clavipes]